MCPKFVKYIVRLFSVIPAKAGIQRYLKFLDSGSRRFAGVARNDD